MRNLAFLVLCTLSGAGHLIAQNCPDVGTKQIPSRVQLGPINTCGSKLEIRTRHVHYQSTQTGCPAWAILEPAHNAPVPRDGSFVKLAGFLSSQIYFMECDESWLFGFIPIVLSSQCRVRSMKNFGRQPTYTEHRCDGEANASGAGAVE